MSTSLLFSNEETGSDFIPNSMPLDSEYFGFLSEHDTILILLKKGESRKYAEEMFPHPIIPIPVLL